MFKALRNTLIWGALYFFASCALGRFVFHDMPTFYGRADQVLDATIFWALGFFFGYRRGQEKPACKPLLDVLIWLVLFLLVGLVLHVFASSSAHTFFGQTDPLPAAAILSAFGYLLGSLCGKKSPTGAAGEE
jgi:hypothetical protein